MTEKAYRKYLNNIDKYISSDSAKKKWFGHDFLKVIVGLIK